MAFSTRRISHHAALALRKAIVSSLLGGFPLKVDAITEKHRLTPDEKYSQIANHTHTRRSTRDLSCNNSSDLGPDAGLASMDTGFNAAIPDQHTVTNPGVTAGNQDRTGGSIQPGNSSSMAHGDLGTGFVPDIMSLLGLDQSVPAPIYKS